jgi:hypothetical protein
VQAHTNQCPNRSVSLSPSCATADDVDGKIWVATGSLPDDPATDQISPYRDKYPDDFWKWARKEYTEYFERPDKFYVIVVTATLGDDGQVTQQPISARVWDLSLPKNSLEVCISSRLIMMNIHNPTRSWTQRTTQRRPQAHESLYLYHPTRTLALFCTRHQRPSSLYTHPDRHRRGAARMICERGENKF